LIRVCRYKVGGYPVPFGPSVPELDRRLDGFHRFSDVSAPQLTFPSSAPNQNPKNWCSRRLFIDSCVQVQRWVGIRYLLGTVSEFNRRLDGFHRFSDVSTPQLTFPSSAPNQNPKNRRNRRLFIDSCVQVQGGWVSGTFWALSPGVQPQIRRISQIFRCHCPAIDFPFLCPKPKSQKTA
jgi:hypothetical protein